MFPRAKELFPTTRIARRFESFSIQNRRYLGNKFKLLPFIDRVVREKCPDFTTFCDIFAGTGVVGSMFNTKDNRIISNDILASNYIPLKTFLDTSRINTEKLASKIALLNKIENVRHGYFSEHFGNTFFSIENAKKIGAIRDRIERIADSHVERLALITSLLYATDRVANTVGHYDAFRKHLDNLRPVRLLVPKVRKEMNRNNQIFNEDANKLVRDISCDILYIDPPYNSRQYSDTYHLLENLATWEKPTVHGIAKKMERSHIKSKYCLKGAPDTFADLIHNAHCKHILVSYNSTESSKDGRSNARITHRQIVRTLQLRGEVEVFESKYKAFTTGKSSTSNHSELLFYCKVK